MKLDKNTSITEDQLLYQLASNNFQDQKKLEALIRKSEQADSEVVSITSAQQLTEVERELILKAIGNVMPVNLEKVQYKVDPSLIAGIRVQSKSYFYDNSIKRKLSDLDGHLQNIIN